jgi:hypothetical protein
MPAIVSIARMCGRSPSSSTTSTSFADIDFPCFPDLLRLSIGHIDDQRSACTGCALEGIAGENLTILFFGKMTAKFRKIPRKVAGLTVTRRLANAIFQRVQRLLTTNLHEWLLLVTVHQAVLILPFCAKRALIDPAAGPKSENGRSTNRPTGRAIREIRTAIGQIHRVLRRFLGAAISHHDGHRFGNRGLPTKHTKATKA